MYHTRNQSNRLLGYKLNKIRHCLIVEHSTGSVEGTLKSQSRLELHWIKIKTKNNARVLMTIKIVIAHTKKKVEIFCYPGWFSQISTKIIFSEEHFFLEISCSCKSKKMIFFKTIFVDISKNQPGYQKILTFFFCVCALIQSKVLCGSRFHSFLSFLEKMVRILYTIDDLTKRCQFFIRFTSQCKKCVWCVRYTVRKYENIVWIFCITLRHINFEWFRKYLKHCFMMWTWINVFFFRQNSRCAIHVVIVEVSFSHYEMAACVIWNAIS